MNDFNNANFNSMDDFFNEEPANNTNNTNVDNFFDSVSEKSNPEPEKQNTDESSIYVNSEEFSEYEIANYIVSKSCGKLEDTDTPAGAFTFTYDKRDENDNVASVLREVSSNKAEFTILSRLEYIQIDMTFQSPLDPELKLIWNTLERFGRDVDRLVKEEDVDILIPSLALTIVPVSENGRYFMSCRNPIMWALQPLIPGSPANTIRFLYPAEHIGFFESDEIDSAEIEASALRELQNRERASYNYYDKQQEEKDYQEHRNQMIEEMRRNGNYS